MSNVPFKEAKKNENENEEEKNKNGNLSEKKTLSRMAIRVYYGKEENTHI
jgi:hypothetical protein